MDREPIDWRKASYSNGSGACVEVGRVPGSWRKASYSNGQGDCVEVGRVPGSVAVRDTKDSDGGTLTFTADAWRRLVATIKPHEAV